MKTYKYVVFIDDQTDCPNIINEKDFIELSRRCLDMKIYSLEESLTGGVCIAFESMLMNCNDYYQLAGNLIDMAKDFSKGEIDSDKYCMTILMINR